jgi:serine/threonine-protein kinase
VQYFTEAVSEDPRYALAHAGLADSYTLLANYGVAAPEDVRPRAKECALRAVEIDSLLPEARTSLAHVHVTYEWDWQSAELEYRAAIQLNPDYATAHHWYAITLLAPLGRLEEAAEEMERALERDPISVSVYRDLGLIHFYRRDYSAALEQARRTQVLDPQFAGGFWLMGLICEQLRMIEAAIAAFDKAVAVSGGNPRMLGALAHARGLFGDREGALAILSQLRELEESRYVSPFETALIRMGLGDLDEAMIWLRRAFEVRSYELVTLEVDPRYDPIRHRTEHEAMLREMRQ